jgi:hypothetical protein
LGCHKQLPDEEAFWKETKKRLVLFALKIRAYCSFLLQTAVCILFFSFFQINNLSNDSLFLWSYLYHKVSNGPTTAPLLYVAVLLALLCCLIMSVEVIEWFLSVLGLKCHDISRWLYCMVLGFGTCGLGFSQRCIRVWPKRMISNLTSVTCNSDLSKMRSSLHTQ